MRTNCASFLKKILKILEFQNIFLVKEEFKVRYGFKQCFYAVQTTTQAVISNKQKKQLPLDFSVNF